ncbi:hypothetical protein BGZ76_008741 [Entomortierella beljakovae]|nr:hypothetical protein BGZ76_008741 [Entomortierella beljakovae]
MSDSEEGPAPKKKPQPKPRSRRMQKPQPNSLGSPTITSPPATSGTATKTTTTFPKKSFDDDFFSKASSFREAVKVQTESYIHESQPELESYDLEPIQMSGEMPILEFEDEAKLLKEQQLKEKPVEVVPKRKREVSLTPPPELPKRYLPTMIPLQKQPAAVTVIDLDGPGEPLEIENKTELDPELASIAAKLISSQHSSPSQSQPMSQHDDTLSSSNSALNSSSDTLESPSSLESGSHPSSSAVIPKMVDILIRYMVFPPRNGSSVQEDAAPGPGMSLKVTMKDNDSFKLAMHTYCDRVNLDFTKVIFTFKKSRLIPSSTPRSLRFPRAAVVDVYGSGEFQHMREREKQRLVDLDRQAEELAQLQEFTSQHQNKQGDQEELEEGVVEYLHIKLRGKDTADEKIRVKKTTTVQSILTHYKNIKMIPEGILVQLEFDDEVIDPGVIIGSTDVEDDDMLLVRVG